MTHLAGLLENRGMRLADLARKLKVNKATVTRWNKKGVPHTRIGDVEHATGIAACDIRPDLAHLFAKARIQ
jgi:transcriptional regulator with XRE-family HTH domain